jgi:hypothetical protein
VDHDVDELSVAHPIAASCLRQRVGRVRHRLHAAGDGEVVLAAADVVRRVHHRFESRSAHFVDRDRPGADRHAGVDAGLPRGGLPDGGLEDIAHDDLLDLIGLHAGVLQRAFDRHRAEARCGKRRESAEEGTDRRACSAEDDDFFHGKLLETTSRLRNAVLSLLRGSRHRRTCTR